MWLLLWISGHDPIGISFVNRTRHAHLFNSVQRWPHRLYYGWSFWHEEYVSSVCQTIHQVFSHLKCHSVYILQALVNKKKIWHRDLFAGDISTLIFIGYLHGVLTWECLVYSNMSNIVCTKQMISEQFLAELLHQNRWFMSNAYVLANYWSKNLSGAYTSSIKPMYINKFNAETVCILFLNIYHWITL